MKDHPELKAQVAALYREATAGNSSAFDFLWAADGYLGEIATLAAKPEADHKEFVRLLAKTNLIYGLPFYLANSAMLFTVMQNALHGILQAVTCPGGADEWQKGWARTAGLVMADVTLSVATIVIGFEKAAALRPKIQEVAWATAEKGTK